MRHQHLSDLCGLFDGDCDIPSEADLVAGIPLGEACDLCCRDSCGKGRISEETFQQIRAFRKKMAEWDRDYGWVGCVRSKRSLPK